jgi:hypothetical protein
MSSARNGRLEASSDVEPTTSPLPRGPRRIRANPSARAAASSIPVLGRSGRTPRRRNARRSPAPLPRAGNAPTLSSGASPCCPSQSLARSGRDRSEPGVPPVFSARASCSSSAPGTGGGFRLGELVGRRGCSSPAWSRFSAEVIWLKTWWIDLVRVVPGPRAVAPPRQGVGSR